jgi:hypothetical protein
MPPQEDEGLLDGIDELLRFGTHGFASKFGI